MRRRYLVSLVALFVCGGLAAQSGSTRQLSADELKKMVDDKKKFFFLDVREPKEIEELGSMKGYVNIPLSQLEERAGEVPKDVQVVTACNRGVRAAKAAAILEKRGYKVIGACGMLEWKEKGYDLVYPNKK